MSIVFFGSRYLGAAALQFLLNQTAVDVDMVVLPLKVSYWEKQVTKIAVENSIPILFHDNKKNKRLEIVLKQQFPQLCIMCSYDYLIPEEVISIPKYGFVNIHPGKLPEYRGPTPVLWQINHKQDIVVTLHYIDEKFDTGPIIDEEIALEALAYDELDLGSDTVEAGVAVASIRLLRRNLPKLILGVVKATPQDEEKAIYYPRWNDD